MNYEYNIFYPVFSTPELTLFYNKKKSHSQQFFSEIEITAIRD